MRQLRWLGAAFILLAAQAAWGVGEVITDVRVRDNVRTAEDTIRSISGVNIGDPLELDTLEKVRERLNTTGLFAEVDVFWEPYRSGVRIVITVKDKFPWAPLPTFSRSPGNVSFGVVVVHGNLFGAGKQAIVGGRVSNVDSGALFAYRDPAVFGTWLYYQLQGRFQDQVLPEFANVNLPGDLELNPLRRTKLRIFGADVTFGVAWFRRVRTQVGWRIDDIEFRRTESEPNSPLPPTEPPLGPATGQGTQGVLSAGLQFDFRVREHAVMTGNALSLGAERSSPDWGSSGRLRWWKLSAHYDHGFKFLRQHNVIFRVGANVGDDLPLWAENSAGGSNLRGYLWQQFRGDTHLFARVEYQFPLFTIKMLQFRGVTFFDNAAVWYRKLPPIDPVTGRYQVREDGRSFLPPAYLKEGFDFNRDVNSGIGGGIRFYLKSVAVPLVGFDVGYSIRDDLWRFLIVVGA